MITVKDVTWSRDQKPILSTVNWQVGEKEHTCILGLNGSGKSTLLKIITGYQYPTSGEVIVLGKRFGENDLRLLRKEIGLVSSALQEQLHDQANAEEIVVSGKHAALRMYGEITIEERERARELLEQFKIAHLGTRSYATLSQGEKQRVLLARALMPTPRLLILDEPTTGLDFIAREDFLKMIEELTEQENCPTLIYVTHHIEELLPCFEHVLLLKNGGVFAQGTRNELLSQKLLQSFFDVPIRLEESAGRVWLSAASTSGSVHT
ncbi:ABC transporter ATP-binding protein [Brevibacillus daliensis]|uniref:ABC transporter ATP-binding protein n=1 Tax=Brevibacillus daliensis TaxID=2892995 RepID=UPI001E55E13F|nr:ABC transporter ATP-binding protein [Brevibacillus daliensis]